MPDRSTGKDTRRVFIKQHGLPQLFGGTMNQGDAAPRPVESHQVGQLYQRGFSDGKFGPTTVAGSTDHFTVSYETDLGPDGVAAAQEVLVKCEPDYKQLAGWFQLSIPHFNVTIARIADQSLDLAFHEDCYSTDLFCDVRDPDEPLDYTSALMVSEAAEAFEAYQHIGWDCGSANGEGLSRVLSAALHPGALDHHASAPAWLDGGRLDLVNYNYPTDTNPLANGCAVLFLNWMRYHLGYDWGQIVAAGGSSLAVTYSKLTASKENPFPRFKALMDKMFAPRRSWPSAPDEPFETIYANASNVHETVARERLERQQHQMAQHQESVRAKQNSQHAEKNEQKSDSRRESHFSYRSPRGRR